MENIPTGYFVFVYAMMALPYIVGGLAVISIVSIAIFYFTNRRQKAMKVMKLSAAILLPILIFAIVTQGSLGIL